MASNEPELALYDELEGQRIEELTRTFERTGDLADLDRLLVAQIALALRRMARAQRLEIKAFAATDDRAHGAVLRARGQAVTELGLLAQALERLRLLRDSRQEETTERSFSGLHEAAAPAFDHGGSSGAAIRRLLVASPQPGPAGLVIPLHRGASPKEGVPEEAKARSLPHAIPPILGVPGGELGAMLDRMVGLLDRQRCREPGDLDLADAVLMLRFPGQWPAYRGPLDLPLVARALDQVTLAPDDLAWIASREFAHAAPPTA